MMYDIYLSTVLHCRNSMRRFGTSFKWKFQFIEWRLWRSGVVSMWRGFSSQWKWHNNLSVKWSMVWKNTNLRKYHIIFL